VPEFTYEAMTPAGQRNRGTLVATSEREAMSMLDARGLFPVRIAAAKSAGGTAAGGKRHGRRIRSRYMATFYNQMSDLLRSGVPLLRSLDILERQCTQPALGEMLREIRARVADGTSLADAMAQHPNAFNELSISMVRAGQEGGFLEDVLKRIADFTEHQEDLKAKVIGALAYPVFLAVVGFLVLNILIVFFVPRFQPIFQKLEEKGELPAITQALMATSNAMQHHLVWVILAGAGLIYAYRRWAATPAGRLRVDHLRLKLPGAGAIYLNLALARFTRILGTLLHNGIPILQSLKIAKDSTGNKVLTQAIDQASDHIKSGDSLATPLAACKYFPRDIVEMVAVGEESNSLETVLLDIAQSLDKRTTRQLELFVRLLEPVMLLFMAGITLIVVAGLLLPVFKMSSAVQ
jgi:general secretion pathway protein F/type IV pilus assembly protein PilC